MWPVVQTRAHIAASHSASEEPIAFKSSGRDVANTGAFPFLKAWFHVKIKLF